MRFPANLRYSKDHTWVRVGDGLATVGLTEFAQYELGEISSVRVNSTSHFLLRGQVFATIVAIAMELQLRLPVSGQMVEVNPLLQAAPGFINKDPYGDGWIIRLQLAKEDEVNDLMPASVYMGGW